MADINEYRQNLSTALNARRETLEKTELPKLKEDFRTYHNGFYSLYKAFLQRGLIHEDPYKAEAKVTEIKAPEVTPFAENERIEQMSLRLSEFDNQLDYLVNFFQFSVEYMTMDNIKRILGLIKFIDWVHFTPDGSASANTKAVVDMVTQSKNGSDPMALSILGEASTNLSRTTGTIFAQLKNLSDYNREVYKLEIRDKITSTMPPQEANSTANIRKKFSAAMPGKPFYPDLVEEIIREDYSKDGAALRSKILKQFDIPESEKPKAKKQEVSFKSIIIDGLFAIGATAAILGEIFPKLEENSELLANMDQGFFAKIKKIIQKMMNKEPESPVYEVSYQDSGRGVMVKEKVVYLTLKTDVERKIKTLTAISSKGAALAKLEAMDETQLIGILERNIRDVQSLQKTLTALDDYFKAAVDADNRNKIKGIKPELATMKNAIVKANQKRYEYSAQKEEEEQFKKLGISTSD
jgi:hypothetical protein